MARTEIMDNDRVAAATAVISGCLEMPMESPQFTY
jgi:hypothetical protein